MTKTIFCGKIPRDDVMNWCLENKAYFPRDKVACGFEWKIDKEIVYTNEDLFIYGVRMAVKAGRISHEDVDIVFFSGETIFGTRILIDRRGGFDNFPTGFMDEAERCLLELI